MFGQTVGIAVHTFAASELPGVMRVLPGATLDVARCRARGGYDLPITLLPVGEGFAK